MVKEKTPMLSAYPLADEPIGSSVPYMPQARPWNARSVNAPNVGEGRDPSSRLQEYVGAKGAKLDDDPAESERQAKKAQAAGTTRPTASVTEIPGAARGAKRLYEEANVKQAHKPVKGATNLKELVAEVGAGRSGKPPVQHLAFPAILYFSLGLVCPPLLLCGCRYTSSANSTAKFFGFASLFMFGVYTTVGLVLFARFWRDDNWSGDDPSCSRYMLDTESRLDTKYGKATSVDSLDAPGLQTTQNVSLYQVGCAYIMQVVVEDTEATQAPRTMIVKVATPGTTGDNFGVYARRLDQKVNPSQGQAPAESWFEEADPFKSNPWPQGNVNFGTDIRPPCKQGMCDGIYGKALPQIAGSQWEVRVPLGWYKYYMGIGVFADSALAVERAFCVDTCVYKHELVEGSDPPEWRDPCASYVDEITQCPNEEVQRCAFARTRAECLGAFTRRREKKTIGKERIVEEQDQDPPFFY